MSTLPFPNIFLSSEILLWHFKLLLFMCKIWIPLLERILSKVFESSTVSPSGVSEGMVQVQVQFYCHIYPYRYRYNEILVPGALSALFDRRQGHKQTTVWTHIPCGSHKTIPTTRPYSVTVYSLKSVQYSYLPTFRFQPIVKQPDCLGEKTITETGGVWFDALVTLLGWEEVEQGVGGVGAIFHDVLCFFLNACYRLCVAVVILCQWS